MSLMDNKITVYNGSKDLRDSNFKEPQVLAEKILKSPATSCSITMPVHTDYVKTDKGRLGSLYEVVTVPFYMSADFGFDLSNEFRELVNIGDNQFVDLFNGIGALTGGSQITPQSEAMSNKVWKGSKFGGFKVDCLFICTNRNNNPVDYIKTLALCCLPRKLKKDEFGGIQGMKDMAKGAIGGAAKLGGYIASGVTQIAKWAPGGSDAVDEQRNQEWHDSINQNAKMMQDLVDDIGMVAPLDYGIDLKENGPIRGTTVTLQIGNWFRASQLLVTSISGVSFSKEIVAPRDERNGTGGGLYKPEFTASANIMSDGFPLYAKCSINLEPCSMMHMDKFKQYFPQSSQLAQNLMNFMGVGGTGGSWYDLP